METVHQDLHDPFVGLRMAPLDDAIIKVTEAFARDSRRGRLNLSIGVYRDSAGQLPLFESVREAERRVQTDEMAGGKGYVPIEGVPQFTRLSRELVFGSFADDEGIVTVQTVGGSGALSLGAHALRELGHLSRIYLTTPCWANHPGIFHVQKVGTESIPYYDYMGGRVQFDLLTHAIRNLEPESVILFQAGCHNPTGIDLSNQQWDEIALICLECGHIPFLDMAYQGLAVSLESDRYSVEAFMRAGLTFLVTHSFSKSMSLYGERVGTLSIRAHGKRSADALLSHLKNLIRPLYSNPPIHGAKIAAMILGEPGLRSRWEEELATLRNRISDIRSRLSVALHASAVAAACEGIADGHGMFALLPITREQVAELADKHALYLVPDGRICIPAIPDDRVDEVADAIGRT